MPPAVMATVPLVGWVIAVMVRVSPVSGSVSLASTVDRVGGGVLGHGGGVVDGVGASLTGVTVTVTVAVSVAPAPSVMV